METAVLSPAPEETRLKKGLDGTQLKWIAIAEMLLDHIGHVIFPVLMQLFPQNAALPSAYVLLRAVGRIAFPIFCFLLTEGFVHTHDVKKYLLRLGAFALISEIPFDYGANGTWLEFGSQNVFFTLFFGLLALWGVQWLAGKPVLQLLFCALCAAAAQLLAADYGFMGVITVILFYVLREHRAMLFFSVGLWLLVGTSFLGLLQLAETGVFAQYPLYVIVVSALSNGLLEAVGAASFFAIARYNGARGHGMPRWFFYAFYPAHLLVLGGIATLLGR